MFPTDLTEFDYLDLVLDEIAKKTLPVVNLDNENPELINWMGILISGLHDEVKDEELVAKLLEQATWNELNLCEADIKKIIDDVRQKCQKLLLGYKKAFDEIINSGRTGEEALAAIREYL